MAERITATMPAAMRAAFDVFIREEGFAGDTAAIQHILYHHLKARPGPQFARMVEIYDAMQLVRAPVDDTKSAVRKHQTTRTERD